MDLEVGRSSGPRGRGGGTFAGARVPIDGDGDARIRDRSFAVPSSCLAPVILVHPNGNLAAYIAVGGWRL